MRNEVWYQYESGLEEWKKVGARVDFLEDGEGGVRVPRIWLAAGSESEDEVVLLTSGHHLEETSGPRLLLDARQSISLLEPARIKGVNFLIYPVINQYGLQYPTNVEEKLLRLDGQGRNYNDGWGMDNPSRKPAEVMLIENDILEHLTRFRVKMGISLHEDSVSPGRGYLWINGFSRVMRSFVRQEIERNFSKEMLATELELATGWAEGPLLVEVHDYGTAEEWLTYQLKIPSICSEAPFGLDLNTRIRFHSLAIGSVLKMALELELL